MKAHGTTNGIQWHDLKTERVSSLDLGLRRDWKAFQERLPSIRYVTEFGGSGFSMSEMLRHFALEYSARYGQNGPWAMPSSFNIVEGFLRFLEPFGPFLLLPEKEHLVDLEMYLDWYTRRETVFPVPLLRHVMEDSVAYVFELGQSGARFPIATGDTSVTIASIGLIRTGQELSAVLLGGEFPPTEGSENTTPDQVPRGKERLQPDPKLSGDDRFLPTFPTHSRTLLLAEFDLEANTYGRRYVMRDLGSRYQVLTDAEDTFDFPPSLSLDRVIVEMRERLDSYTPLSSTLLALLPLPSFFLDMRAAAFTQKVATRLNDHRRKAKVRNAGKVDALRPIPYFRDIQCLPTTMVDKVGPELTLVPPPTSAANGYWKTLEPGQIGLDREKNQTVGRTWVTRTESWSARPPASLLVRKIAATQNGRAPGFLYLARSSAHVPGLLKIGITTRRTEERMAELGATTSSPMPFEVLWQWPVGDAPRLEKAVHVALNSFRVRESREFFQVDLSVAVNTVERLLKDKQHT